MSRRARRPPRSPGARFVRLTEIKLQRTREDKRRAVMTLLSDPEWSQWSDRKIAEACKVGHTLVSSMRQTRPSLSSADSEQPRETTEATSTTRKFLTKHGTEVCCAVEQTCERPWLSLSLRLHATSVRPLRWRAVTAFAGERAAERLALRHPHLAESSMANPGGNGASRQIARRKTLTVAPRASGLVPVAGALSGSLVLP